MADSSRDHFTRGISRVGESLFRLKASKPAAPMSVAQGTCSYPERLSCKTVHLTHVTAHHWSAALHDPPWAGFDFPSRSPGRSVSCGADWYPAVSQLCVLHKDHLRKQSPPLIEELQRPSQWSILEFTFTGVEVCFSLLEPRLTLWGFPQFNTRFPPFFSREC